MLVALAAVEFEEAESRLVQGQLCVGGLFRIEFAAIDCLLEASAEIAIERPLSGDALRAIVVELLIEPEPVVYVVSDAGRIHRRKGERSVHKFEDDVLGGRAFRRAAGEQTTRLQQEGGAS